MIEYLGKEVEVKIDRPLGTRHPEYNFYYSVNCGYIEGAKTKSYSLTIKSDLHKEQLAFQETDYFKERAKERYKIEAKNSEIKHRHSYDVATGSGLIGMQMQGALTIFAANMERIMKLKSE